MLGGLYLYKWGEKRCIVLKGVKGLEIGCCVGTSIFRNSPHVTFPIHIYTSAERAKTGRNTFTMDLFVLQQHGHMGSIGVGNEMKRGANVLQST